MNNEKKKNRKPFLWLLGIPIVTLLSVLIGCAGVFLEASMYNSAPEPSMGHPAPPILSFLAISVGVIFFLVGNFVVLILFAAAMFNSRDKRKKEQQKLSQQ